VRALQIHLFLTNKANFQKSQVNVTVFITRNYGQMDTWSSEKNKANSNPIQTQFKANTKPKQTQFKPKQTQFGGKNMLPVFAPLEVLATAIMTGYYLEPIRNINHRRLP